MRMDTDTELLAFEADVELAGLKQVRYGEDIRGATYVVWKPGVSCGWLVRPCSDSCYCSDCFELDRWSGRPGPTATGIIRTMKNAGLASASVGGVERRRPGSLMSDFVEGIARDLRCYGISWVPLEECEVFGTFMSIHTARQKKELASEQVNAKRQEIKDAQVEQVELERKVSTLTEELKSLESELSKLQ